MGVRKPLVRLSPGHAVGAAVPAGSRLGHLIFVIGVEPLELALTSRTSSANETFAVERN